MKQTQRQKPSRQAMNCSDLTVVAKTAQNFL